MPITDNFTGTNGTGLPSYSANWEYVSGSAAALQIQSNGFSVDQATFVEYCARRTDGTFPDAHYGQVGIAASGQEVWVGPAVRCQAAGSGDCYGYYGRGTPGTAVSYLFELDNGVFTILGMDGNGFVAGNVIRLAVSGTTITPTIDGSTDGTPGAQTDATHSGGRPGVVGYSSNSVYDTRGDDFESTDPVGAGPSVLPMFATLTNTRLRM